MTINRNMTARQFEINYLSGRVREGALALNELRAGIRDDVARALTAQEREDRSAFRSWLASQGHGWT